MNQWKPAGRRATIARYRSGSTYTVQGLTCAVCIAELIEAVRFLPHVTGVEVSLVTGGASPLVVYSDAALEPAVVLECVARAGFQGSVTPRRRVTHLQRTFTRSA